MKKCPICGREYAEGKYCSACGIVLIDVHHYGEKKEEKKENRKVIREEPQNKGSEKEAEYEPDMSDLEIDSEEQRQWNDIIRSVTGESGRDSKEALSKERKNAGFQISPKTAGGAVAAVCLIAAVVFVFKGMEAKRETEQQTPDYNVQFQTGEPEQWMDTQKHEKEMQVDMAEVDIDGYNETYPEISGIVEDNGSLVLELETPQNVYVSDSVQNKAVLVKDTVRILIDDSAGFQMGQYAGRRVTLQGQLWAENSQVKYYVTGIIEAEPKKEDTGIHQYEVVLSDCTWEQARQSSMEKGGYLVRINTAEEFNHIVNLLNNGGHTKVHFYLGGRRDSNGKDYYWVDDKNEFLEGKINDMGTWYGGHWFQGEPSLKDTGSDAHGMIEESVMNLFHVSGNWYFNDSSENLMGNYPDLLAGKVGYIVEYE